MTETYGHPSDVMMPMDDDEFKKYVGEELVRSGTRGTVTSRSAWTRGIISELIVAADATERGYFVLIPLDGGHSQYDLVVEKEGKLLRVQVKTIKLKDYAVSLITGGKRYIKGAFDYLAAVDRETRNVYWVPESDIDFSKTMVPMRGKEAYFEF